MRLFIILLVLVFVGFQSCAQNKNVPTERAHCQDPKFDTKVAELINFTVPTIGVSELKKELKEVYLFDAREKEEYNVSHIPGAEYLGYSSFEESQLKSIPKDAKVVLYCSIGYRSEKIGEKLQEMGFTNVHNLYGSIFEWVNQGHGVVNENGTSTREVHVYNRQWGEWVKEGSAKKVW